MQRLLKNSIILSLTLISLLFSSEALYATNGMRVIGIGPVQRAMGGANVGAPQDAASTLTNPGAIGEVGRQIDFGVTFFDPDVSYRAHSSMGMVLKDNERITSDAEPFIIPAFGMVLPINEKVTFGVGAYGVSGMGVDYEANLYQNVTFTKYTYMKFAPAIAYKLTDRLSIGVCPNFNYATMDYEAGAPTEKAHHGATSFGFGAAFGAHYRFSEVLSAGIAYETKQWFPDFEFNTIIGKDKLAFEQPQTVAIGVGITPNDRITIACDVMWINWSNVMGEGLPEYTLNNSGAAPWSMGWDDQFVYKIGAAYECTDKITLRVGYNYGKNPLDSFSAFENIAFPAVAEHHLTCGVGYSLTEHTVLNIGMMYAPKITLDTANPMQAIDEAETEMSQFAVDVGISYLF